MRKTTETYDRVDINVLAKVGAIAIGRHTVTHKRKDGSTYDVEVYVPGDNIGDLMQLTLAGQKPIEVDWCYHKVKYGSRARFICPKCEQPCTHIYAPDGECRTCCGLGYKSTSQRPKRRKLDTIEQMERELGWSGDQRPRPKGMHQPTYEKLCAKYDKLRLEVSPGYVEPPPPPTPPTPEEIEMAKWEKRRDEQWEYERQERARASYSEPDIVHDVLGFGGGSRVNKPRGRMSAAWSASGKQIR